MVRWGYGARYQLHYEKSRIFNAYLFLNFEMTIMSMGDKRRWFNSDKFADLMVVLMCPSGWNERRKYGEGGMSSITL